MTALRWTVLASHVPPNGSLGGIVRYTVELIRALAKRDDVIVSAVTTRAAADFVGELVGAAGHVDVLPDMPTPALAWTERHVAAATVRHGADVVHGCKHLLPTHTSALRVLTVHDMLLFDRPHDFGPGKRRLLRRPYLGSINDADLVLCVSEATRMRVIRHVPTALRRTEVVRLATSTTLRESEPQPVPALVGRRFALVVGDHSRRKNLRTVITAWSSVVRRHPDAVLAIAGPPSWASTDTGGAYERLVARGALVPLGQLSDAELHWAYAHAAVSVAPSLAEGFGLPAAEALDFGAPLVISDDAALRETAKHRAAAVVPALDVDEWVGAVDALLSCRTTRGPAQRVRTWDDVAAETVDAARYRLRGAPQPALGSRTPFWTMSRSR